MYKLNCFPVLTPKLAGRKQLVKSTGSRIKDTISIMYLRIVHIIPKNMADDYWAKGVPFRKSIAH